MSTANQNISGKPTAPAAFAPAAGSAGRFKLVLVAPPKQTSFESSDLLRQNKTLERTRRAPWVCRRGFGLLCSWVAFAQLVVRRSEHVSFRFCLSFCHPVPK